MSLRCLALSVTMLFGFAAGRRLQRNGFALGVDTPQNTCSICDAGQAFKAEHVLQTSNGTTFTCQQAQEWTTANATTAEECNQAQMFFMTSCCEEDLKIETCNVCPLGYDFKSDFVLRSREGVEYTCQDAQDGVRSGRYFGPNNVTLDCPEARTFWAPTCCEDATCSKAYRPLVKGVDVATLFTAAMDWDWSITRLTKSRSYGAQWDDAASEVLVLPGAADNFTLTWGSLFPDVEGYTFERDRLLSQGRLSEKFGYIVNESTVRNVCDLHVDTLKYLTRQPKFIGKLWLSLPGVGCVNTTLKKLGADVRDAIEEECFGECESTMTSLFDGWNVTCEQLTENFKNANASMTQKFFQLLMNRSQQCLTTPYDTLEKLTDFVISKRCHTFHSPRFLWQPQYKEPGDVTETQFTGVLGRAGGMLFKGLVGDVGSVYLDRAAQGFGQAVGTALDTVDTQSKQNRVCKMPEEHLNSGYKEYIQQNGSCPEGSKCKCPQTRIFPRQTSQEIIGQSGSIFVATGAAAGSSILSQFAMGFVMQTVFATSSLGLLGAISANLAAPTFLFKAGAQFGTGVVIDYFTFECQKTLGCWPQQPDSVKVPDTPDACRLPEKAKEGGSPLWFLPPPMLRMKHSKLKCILDKCENYDYMNQTVGLGRSPNDGRYKGKPNIYNCQPLSFEVMTPLQRVRFLKKLEETGIGEEYDLQPAKDYITYNADPSPNIRDLKPKDPKNE